MQLVNTKKSSNYLSLVKVKDIVLLITVEVFTTSKKASEDRENIIQCRLPGASGQVQLPKSQWKRAMTESERLSQGLHKELQ